MARFDPYFNFEGDAEEAMRFYQSVFGGKVDVVRFADFPGGTDGLPAAEHGLSMHAALQLPGGALLMASDMPAQLGRVTFGNATNVMIGVESTDEARQVYDGLSAGAKSVEMPLGKTGFAELYASLQDRYGIHWMVFLAGNKGS